MPTNDERRRLAGNMRVFDVVSDAHGRYWLNGRLFGMDITARSEEGLRIGMARLASFIEPDAIPDKPDETGRPLSKPIERWTSFDDRLPDPGTLVLCRSKNGVFYVGKPVTAKGKRTRMVWVPRGGQYRTPDMWRPIEVPAGSAEIDLEALLSLADEMERDAKKMNAMGYNYDHQIAYARRIRKALGVEQ